MSDAPGGSALEVFYSYAQADEALRRQLETRLKSLERQGFIVGWHRGLLPPGANYRRETEQHLQSASLILLLLSPEYIACDECYAEMERALDRYHAGEALVVPVLLRPVEFDDLPVSTLQPLPIDGKAVSEWISRDRAWRDIARGIRHILEHERAEPALSAPTRTRLWNIPYGRNMLFTGRDDLLQQLHDQLTQRQVATLTQPQAIHGLGGIGKTQLAIEYAYRHRQDYQAVLWVNAANREALLGSFLELAALLKLPERTEADHSRVVAATKAWFASHDSWLVIFDNADELSLVESFLPAGDKGHLLLTTRAHAVGLLAHGIEVEQMQEQEGMLLLLRRAKVLASDAPLAQAQEADRQAARAIVCELDGLPLALEQAGAFLEETQCGLSTYLERYRQHQIALLQRRGGTSTQHPDPVATTWSLAFQRVEALDPLAADLLRFCAFLAPDDIPEQLVTGGASELGSHLHPLSKNALRFDEAIGNLLRYSLVKRKRDESVITVHRLVQAIVRTSMEEQTQREWVGRTVRAVNRAFPKVDDYRTWPRWQQLLPHVRTCTNWIDQQEVEVVEAGTVWNETGVYLKQRAQYAEAGTYYQRAIAIGEKMLGLEHPDVAARLNNLALLYAAQGRYEEAEPLLKRALAIGEKVLGPEHLDLANRLNNLGNLYREQGRYEEAEPLLKRALAIDEQLLDPEHSDLGSKLNNLALLYVDQGQYEQAELLYQRALAIDERLLDPEHPTLATRLNNLAALYIDQGQYEQAEPLIQRALAIREKIFGPEHPYTIVVRENLAELLRRRSSQGKREQG